MTKHVQIRIYVPNVLLSVFVNDPEKDIFTVSTSTYQNCSFVRLSITVHMD
jgi:hypothetical protein